jgi:threonine dehydrogenase-like Zn-dependent dehydrogenase
VDADPDRAAVAAALGASASPRPPTARETYPITVDGSNDPRGLRRALQSLEPEGICTSVSIYFGGDVALPLLSMYTRGVRFVTGRVNSRAALPRVLELVASGGLRPERVTSEIIPWDQAAEALARPSLKPIVVRGA